MANFDVNDILRFIIVLSLFPASSAKVDFKEGCSLMIEEGKTLTITCLSTTTADIDFMFNDSLIGTCFYSFGECNTNDLYNFTANVGMEPYQYVLTSKTGVNTSFSGTYDCQDGTENSRSSIDVSVTPDGIDKYDFVEEGNTISLTLSCSLGVTRDNMSVEWFTFDNITLTKLNLPSDIIDTFLNETSCTACDISSAQNISTGLVVKPTTKSLTYVYIEVQMSHQNTSIRNRTGKTYPAKVVASDSGPSDNSAVIILSICCPAGAWIILLFVFCWLKKCNPCPSEKGLCNVGTVVLICIATVTVIPMFCWIMLLLKEKKEQRASDKVNFSEEQPSDKIPLKGQQNTIHIEIPDQLSVRSDNAGANKTSKKTKGKANDGTGDPTKTGKADTTKAKGNDETGDPTTTGKADKIPAKASVQSENAGAKKTPKTIPDQLSVRSDNAGANKTSKKTKGKANDGTGDPTKTGNADMTKAKGNDETGDPTTTGKADKDNTDGISRTRDLKEKGDQQRGGEEKAKSEGSSSHQRENGNLEEPQTDRRIVTDDNMQALEVQPAEANDSKDNVNTETGDTIPVTSTESKPRPQDGLQRVVNKEAWGDTNLSQEPGNLTTSKRTETVSRAMGQEPYTETGDKKSYIEPGV